VAAPGRPGWRTGGSARALRDAHRRGRVRLRGGTAARTRRRGRGDRFRRRRPSRLRDRPGWQRGRAVDLGRSRAPALTLLAFAALAAPASAASVSVEGRTLRVTAAAGEANALTISGSTVTDTGAPLTAGPGCAPAPGGAT